MKKIPVILFILFCAAPAHARDQIRIVGSTTLYPLVTIAAENFGHAGKFPTPIIESTGTGGGLKLFCSGTGDKFPDIANASRRIKPGEAAECGKNGVGDILEIKIGYDGIVLATGVSGPKYNLTKEQIFKALARQIPQNGKLIDNPYHKWSEIDKKLPAEKIVVYGPPPTDGTRDSFAEQVLQESCANLPEFKATYPNAKTRAVACKFIREDGAYVEIGSNYNLIIQKLINSAGALGIMGYNYLAENAGKIRGAAVDGVTPDFSTITEGKYPLARGLYIYVKSANIAGTPGIREFLRELVSEKAIGQEGYLVEKGLVPLKQKEFLEERGKILGAGRDAH